MFIWIPSILSKPRTRRPRIFKIKLHIKTLCRLENINNRIKQTNVYILYSTGTLRVHESFEFSRRQRTSGYCGTGKSECADESRLMWSVNYLHKENSSCRSSGWAICDAINKRILRGKRVQATDDNIRSTAG